MHALICRYLRFQLVGVVDLNISGKIRVVLHRHAVDHCYYWLPANVSCLGEWGRQIRTVDDLWIYCLSDAMNFKDLVKANEFQLRKILDVTDGGGRQFTEDSVEPDGLDYSLVP